MDELKKLVEEHNNFLAKANEKWEEIYDEIQNMYDPESDYDIGSMISCAMYNELDPYSSIQIDIDKLIEQIEEAKKSSEQKGN